MRKKFKLRNNYYNASTSQHHTNACRGDRAVPCRQHLHHLFAACHCTQPDVLCTATHLKGAYISCQRRVMWRPGPPRVPRLCSTCNVPPVTQTHNSTTTTHPQHTLLPPWSPLAGHWLHPCAPRTASMAGPHLRVVGISPFKATLPP